MDIEDVQCTVCYERFDGDLRCPKVLPCGHSFCTQCIQAFLAVKLRCPTCKTFIKGPINIPTNWDLKKLVEKYSSRKVSESSEDDKSVDGETCEPSWQSKANLAEKKKKKKRKIQEAMETAEFSVCNAAHLLDKLNTDLKEDQNELKYHEKRAEELKQTILRAAQGAEGIEKFIENSNSIGETLNKKLKAFEEVLNIKDLDKEEKEMSKPLEALQQEIKKFDQIKKILKQHQNDEITRGPINKLVDQFLNIYKGSKKLPNKIFMQFAHDGIVWQDLIIYLHGQPGNITASKAVLDACLGFNAAPIKESEIESDDKFTCIRGFVRQLPPEVVEELHKEETMEDFQRGQVSLQIDPNRGSIVPGSRMQYLCPLVKVIFMIHVWGKNDSKNIPIGYVMSGIEECKDVIKKLTDRNIVKIKNCGWIVD